MGQKHPEAGCLHRAVFPNRMTEQPAVTQKVLRTKSGWKAEEKPDRQGSWTKRQEQSMKGEHVRTGSSEF